MTFCLLNCLHVSEKTFQMYYRSRLRKAPSSSLPKSDDFSRPFEGWKMSYKKKKASAEFVSFDFLQKNSITSGVIVR